MIRVTITGEDGSGIEYYAEHVTRDPSVFRREDRDLTVSLASVNAVTYIPATKPDTTDHPYTAVYLSLIHI